MSKQNKQLNTIVKGGLLLTASSFISKLLSALYKIPFQNLTGDEGFYVYQQVYPLYGLAVALTMTGLPVFVSKIISETNDEFTQREKLQELNTWFVLLGFFSFLFLQLSASALATGMGDMNLTPVIQVTSYFFLFSPVLALGRGLFQGSGNMVPTSVSQVIEQFVRVGILLSVAFAFPRSEWSFYEMGKNAYHSAWASAAVASVVLILFLREHNRSLFEVAFLKPKFSLAMGKRLFTEGFLLVAVGSLMVLFQFIDSFTVYNALIETGYSTADAMAFKGVYDRGQPLVQLGLVVGISFSMTSLPILRKYALDKRWYLWTKEATSIVKLTILLSGAAAVGLMAVMPWMNYTLFTDYKGTQTLQVMMISVLLVSLIYCLHTLMQSHAKKDNTLLYLSVGLLVKLLWNGFAVRQFGIMGSSVVTIFSLSLILISLMYQIDIDVFKQLGQNLFIPKLLLLFAMLYGSVFFSLSGLQILLPQESRISALILTLVGVIIGVVVFAIGLLTLKLLNKNEMKQISLPNWFTKRRE